MTYLIREWCKKRRGKLGSMTFTELAELSGVRRSTISAIANGRSNPHRVTVDAIARALGIRAETLQRQPKNQKE